MERFSDIEFRWEADGKLSGIVMRYGEVSPTHQERFEPGSIKFDDVTLDVLHDPHKVIARTQGGGVELRDSPTELRIEATPPPTQEARDAHLLVQTRVLRGFSVGFNRKTVKDKIVDGVRVISHADLISVGLVDKPSYPSATAEARVELLGKNNPRRRKLWL